MSDEIVYLLEEGRVIMSTATSCLPDDPFTTFEEWDSDADREAYRGL